MPSPQTLGRWVACFREGGSVAGVRRRARRPRISSGVVAQVRRAIARNPRLSVRQLGRRAGVSGPTIHRILRRQLQLFPYKLELSQRLQRGDRAKRARFCRWLLGQWGKPRFRRFLLVSDEAHFYLNGQVNKQNCRLWGHENPHALVEQDQHPAFVTVWCGLSTQGIIGPNFFQSRGRTVTVTGARYKDMLDNFLVPELHRRHIPLRRVWFQQDGASPHTTRWVLARLQALFPGRVLSKGGSVPWPPRSPDLSPLDFFLWGHLKTLVFAQPIRSLRQLRNRISSAVATLPPSTFRRAMAQLPLRCRLCLRRRGDHMEGVLFR